MAEDERDQGSGIGGANAAFPRYAVADPLAANALRGVARLGPQQRDAAAVEALRLRNRPDIAPHPLPKLALPHAVQKQQPVAAAGPKQKIDDKVNPVIKPDKLTVVVRKFHKDPAGKNRPYTNPKRQAVVLSTDTVFDGTGTFTRSSDRIKFFKSTSGSDEIKFNGKDNVFKGAQLTAGITVFAEATKPSDAPEDVKLTLKLAGGKKTIGPDAVSSATSVELTLDVCQPKTGAGDPPALSTDDKINVGRAIVEQNKQGTHERALMFLRPVKPNGYKGNFVLTAPKGHVAAFHNEKTTKGEARVDPYTDKLEFVAGQGRKLWVEGVAASNDMRDARFQVGIQGVEDDADHVLISVVKLTLDICKSRSKAAKKGSDPEAMTADDRAKVGRFLHEQDAGNHHGRALLIVRAVQPKKFDGTLVLKAIDPASTELYATELPKAGQAPIAPPELDYKKTKNEDKKFWVQGKKKSANPRDVGYLLSVKGHRDSDAEKAPITVCKFSKLKATIKATPANKPANSTAAGIAAPADHTLDRASFDEDFATNKPLVLIRNAQPDIQLELTAEPAGLPIQWDAVRNPKDEKSIGDATKKPTRTRDPANFYKCKLDANERGSFRVRPFIDCNGSNDYDEGEPSMPLNFVLVDVTVRGPDRSVATTVPTPEVFLGDGSFQVAHGVWPGAAFTSPGNVAMIMNLDVDLLGGGSDGKLGLDKVFAGLQNQTLGHIHQASYFNATTVPPKAYNFRFRYASNKAAATGNFLGDKMFKPGDPAPALYTFPLLDSGRSPNGQGGDTVAMSYSQTRPTPNQPALGQRIEIWCADRPRRAFPPTHPLDAGATLIAVRYQHQFQADFLVWTNISKNSGATGDPADRVYSVVRKVPWGFDGNWTLDYVTNPGTPTFARNAYAVTSVGATTVNPVGRAQDHAIEVRPPSGIAAGIVVDVQ